MTKCKQASVAFLNLHRGAIANALYIIATTNDIYYLHDIFKFFFYGYNQHVAFNFVVYRWHIAIARVILILRLSLNILNFSLRRNSIFIISSD
ncbi:hypothetical protein IQ238_10380 [Pleurocapsales cyanobacterium LEGE 06147]|nr:hypothetical protein [Pleurocapsales cyanobacterium LEGE 06147]